MDNPHLKIQDRLDNISNAVFMLGKAIVAINDLDLMSESTTSGFEVITEYIRHDIEKLREVIEKEGING